MLKNKLFEELKAVSINAKDVEALEENLATAGVGAKGNGTCSGSCGSTK